MRIRWSRSFLAAQIVVALIGVALLASGLLIVRGAAGGGLAILGIGCFAMLGYVEIQLRRVDQSNWLISWDIPEPLQFGAYIGQQEGFSAQENQASGQTERAWRVWWHALHQRVFAYESHMQEVFQAHADLPPLELWRTVGTPESFDYDPPAFSSLRDQPVLQELCRYHWPEFERRWQAEKPLLIDKLRRQGRTVRENQIVRACVQAAGKPASAPFFLRLDFIRWPETYHEQRSAQHIVLGVQYLEPASADQLRAIIAAAVAPLV